MTNFLKEKYSKSRGVLLVATTATLVGVGIMFNDLSSSFKSLGSLQSGLQICTTRVGQTYTASVIGDTSSIYLDSNFTGATEECFAEASSLAEAQSAMGKVVSKRMNSINSNVHWFHEGLRATGNGFNITETKTKNSNDIDVKYQAVEESVEAAIEHIDSHAETLNSSLSNLKMALALSTLILIFAGGWEVADRARRRKAVKEIEEDAFNELISDDSATAAKIEKIIVNALELHEMSHCSKLLSTYSSRIFKTEDTIANLADILPMTMITGNKSENVDDKIEQIWANSDQLDEIIATSAIGDLTTKVVNHLSNKLIAEGIIVDVDVDDSMIFGDQETVEQIIYYVTLDALVNSDKSQEKRIELKGKRLGGIYNLELYSYGTEKSTEANTSIQIASELLSDINGKIEVNNRFNKEREVIGCQTRVIFKSSADIVSDTREEEITITRLEKGTKRELMARLADS